MSEPVTDPRDVCRNGGYVNFVAMGTNTRFTSEAACIAEVDQHGYVNSFSPPSFNYQTEETTAGRYTARLSLSDWPPNTVIAIRAIYSIAGEVSAGTVTTDAQGAATVQVVNLRCSDARGIVVGASATHPTLGVIREVQTMDLPCGQ